MTSRRDAREWALQCLFQVDLNPSNKLDDIFKHFWEEKDVDDKMRIFTEELVKDVCKSINKIDNLIQKYSEHWTVTRMGVIDRNVMRIAICEMLFRDDIPMTVSINEAVDIAKYFSNNESGKFVNAILDRIKENLT